jgi:hypothetical protein
MNCVSALYFLVSLKVTLLALLCPVELSPHQYSENVGKTNESVRLRQLQ